MTVSQELNSSSLPTRESGDDPLAGLAELQRALSSGEALTGCDDMLNSIKSAIDQVMTEHNGLAEELIAVYEQLGIIFEITRKLPSLQTESEIVSLFLSSVRRSFGERRVVVARPSGDQAWSFDADSGCEKPWLLKLVKRACDQRKVIVDRPKSDNNCDIAEVLVGPVWSGQTLLFCIVFLRPVDRVEFRASEMLLVESLTNFCGDLIRNHRLVHELREMSISMVRSLVSAVDQKDEYTCGHSLRVAYYARKLGASLGMGKIDLQMLQWSALLHDVGKIGIRDSVLTKEGKLTSEEFDHIQEHPVRSHHVVREIPHLADALDGILYHHERFDGSGYPEGLKGTEIPLQARVVQTADVFDALTSTRSYRHAYTWRQALDIMASESGRTLDPRLQRHFDELIRRTLRGDERAWEQMTQEANSFVQDGSHVATEKVSD